MLRFVAAVPNRPTRALSRRDLLRFLGVAALAVPAIAAGCARDGADDIDARSREALWRAGIVPEGDAAVELGRLYRDLHPDQRSLAGLCGRIGGDPLPVTVEEWRAAAARERRSDLEAGRSIELDGWIVTLTEARLLALASLR